MRFLHRPARVLALLVAAAAVLITLDLRGGASFLRSAGAAMTGPVEQALAAAARPLSALAGAGEARRRAEELERRNIRLAAELWAERAAGTRDAQRAELLPTYRAEDARPAQDAGRAQDAGPAADGRRDAPPSGRARLTVVTAQVIAARDDTVTIDAGTRAGVRPDLAVVTSDGLAGRVIEAGPSVATVLLPTAPSATIGVRAAATGKTGRESGGAMGTVTGRREDGLLALRLFDADAPLRPGQRVETLGSSGRTPYPPGVPVGTVERVDAARDQLTRTALVRPAVTFGTLDVVGVIVDAG
ncbi:rod shape-determining protein MreC [Nonomuraea jabiensis]|uniref:rod shape-determining protein MreC n=1 Tax=Nonomuraea jabiensis TaxID=882448 RepID=UPI003415CE7E